jgi:hypothetical protein
MVIRSTPPTDVPSDTGTTGPDGADAVNLSRFLIARHSDAAKHIFGRGATDVIKQQSFPERESPFPRKGAEDVNAYGWLSPSV